MDILAAVNMLLALVSTVSEVSLKLKAVGDMIQKAQSEGRTTFTPDEWAAITKLDDDARAALQAAIDAQKP